MFRFPARVLRSSSLQRALPSARGFTAGFHKSAPALQQAAAASPEATVEEPESFGSLIEKYGVVPFVGAIGAVALTKEMVMIDAHLVSYVMSTACFAGVYTFAAPEVNAMIEEEEAASQGLFDSYFDGMVGLCEHHQKMSQWQLDFASVLREGATEFADVNEQLKKARVVQLKVDARAAMIERLEALASVKQAAASSDKEDFLKELEADILAMFDAKTGDKKQQKLALEYAINNIEKDSGAKSPVAVAFEEGVKKHSAKYSFDFDVANIFDKKEK